MAAPPVHVTPEFHSSFLGRVTLASLDHVTLGQLTELVDELGAQLTLINGEIKTCPGADATQLRRLCRQRAALAPLHQKALRRKRDLRFEQQGTVPPLEVFLQQVARQELDVATYQRLLLIAETRRATAMAEATGMAYDRS